MEKEDPIVIAATMLLCIALIQVPCTIVLALRLVLADWGGR